MWDNINWPFSSDAVTHLVISDGVTSIGDNAFKEFYNLEIPTSFPNSLTSIGDYAFYNCTNGGSNNGNSVTIPSSVKSIGDYAFNMTKLNTLVLNEGLEIVGEYAFGDNSLLKDVTIPSTLKKVSDGMFMLSYGADNELKVTFSTQDGVSQCETIGNNAFNGCKINTITIPEGVKQIGDYAFAGNANSYGIKTLALPDSLNYIGVSAFMDNRIETITIPENVKYIGKSAFRGPYWGNTYTKTLNIQNGSVVIGEEAFSCCKALETVDLSGVSEIGNKAFYACENIETLTLGDGLKLIGESAIYTEKLSEVTIPNGVTDIRASAFSGCSSLETAVVPDSVAYLGGNAFYNTKVTAEMLGQGWHTLDGKPFDFSKNSNFQNYKMTPDLYRETSNGRLKVTDGLIRYTVTGRSDEHSFIGTAPNPYTAATHEIECNIIEKQTFTFYAMTAPESKYLIDKVTYKVGGAAPVVLKGSNGKYTIPSGKITDNTVIEVTAKPIVLDLSKCTVTAGFIKDGKIVENSTEFDKAKAVSAEGITADEVTIKQGASVLNLVAYQNDSEPYDYKISYLNNKAAGTAYVVVTANPDNIFITGKAERAFIIKGGNIANSKAVRLDYSNKVVWKVNPYENFLEDFKAYDITGNDPRLLKAYDSSQDAEYNADADYMLVCPRYQQPGKQTATLIGLNAFDGSKDLSYTIEKPKIDKVVTYANEIEGPYGFVVRSLDSDLYYTGEKVFPYTYEPTMRFRLLLNNRHLLSIINPAGLKSLRDLL